MASNDVKDVLIEMSGDVFGLMMVAVLSAEGAAVICFLVAGLLSFFVPHSRDNADLVSSILGWVFWISLLGLFALMVWKLSADSVTTDSRV